jgi:RND family efflux transporter MFP subunit
MTTKHKTTYLTFIAVIFSFNAAHSAESFECLIEPTQTVDIKSPVVGLLQKMTVRRGDTVHEGQELAYLESSAETAATALALFKSEMTAPTTSAENKIEYARRKYQRRKEMRAENFISEQELDEAESELKLAESELKMAIENKELAKLEWQQQNSLLNLRIIHSPFDGVVVEQNIYPGEVVEPGGQKENILKLAQLNPLRVYVILPMSAFGKVTTGMQVNVTPELPIGGNYRGAVKIIDRVVDAASGTFGVFLEVANPKLTVPAGVKCKAEFPIDLNRHGNTQEPSKKLSPSRH